MKRGGEEAKPERGGGAVWEVCVCVCAGGLLTLGSSGTGAFVSIDQVNAGAPVLARLRETFIDLHRTVGPQEAGQALGGGRGQVKRRGRGGRKKRKTAGQKRGSDLDQCLT